MQNIKRILAVLLCLGLTGCGILKVDVLYTPTSIVTGEGNIQVRKFQYIPAEEGKSKPNEIRNTTIGTLVISENVDQYFTNAIRSELKYAGFNIGRGDLFLSGDILDLLSDDFGLKTDWKLSVTFRLYNLDGTVPIYEKNVNVGFRTGEFVWQGMSPQLNKLIRLSFEELMTDEGIKKILKTQNVR